MPESYYDDRLQNYRCIVCGRCTDFCICDVVNCCICDAECTPSYIMLADMAYCPKCDRDGRELQDCGEGPWATRKLAAEFANAEVPEPYRVRFCADDGLWHVDLVPYPR